MENPQMSPDELKRIANEQLLEVIRVFVPTAGGVAPVICEPFPIFAGCTDVWVNEEQTIFSLGFVLLFGPDHKLVIRDRAAGFGESIEAACRFAASSWATSVFVAALAFYDAESHPGHMASYQDLSLPGSEGRNHTWRVISSPAIAISVNHGKSGKVKTPFETQAYLEPLIRKLALKERQVHWVKVILAPMAAATIDCALNNEKSEEVNGLFADFEWPPNSDIKVLRQFHILAPNVSFEPATGTTSIPLLAKT